MKREAAVPAICLLILLWLGPEARADLPGQGTATPEQLLFLEVPVVVSASRMGQPATEAPSSVSIVTADEIRKYGYRTLADLIRGVRGFFVSYDRNYHNIGVRGFSRPGDFNTRVLVLVDGHRVNENIYDSGAIGTDFILDVDLIDHVEVVRGPGSSLYGSNAFFAVVNVITKSGHDFEGAEVSGAAGTFDTRKGRLTLGDRFNNGAEGVLSGSYSDSEGDDHLFFREFDSPATNNGIAEDLDYDRSYNWFGKFSLRDFTLSGAHSYRKKGVPTAAYGTAFNEDFFTVDEHSFVDLKYERSFAHNLSLMARLNWNSYRFYGDFPYDYAAPGGPPFIVVNKSTARGKWWGSEVLGNKEFERHKLILGAEYRDNYEQNQKAYDPFLVYLDDRRDSQVWALFAQDEVAILRNLILNAGIRHDHYDTFGGTTNPRLAVIWSPARHDTVKLIYGTAFRAPSDYELNAWGAADLKPEEIKTWELIYERYLGSHLRGTASLFASRIEEIITLTTDPAGNRVYRNIGEAESKGIDFELEGRWENDLTGRASYTFQETEDRETGETLSNSPKHLAKLNVVVPLLKEKIFLGLEEQFTSRRKTPKGNKAEAYYVTNVTLFSQGLLKNLEASASIYNLFDDDYDDPASLEHRQDQIPQDGRTFRAKLTYRF
jgi:iron complex outermembrane receptor protein